jgi:pimeloyl-ACP methyl ester carboxylesterase
VWRDVARSLRAMGHTVSAPTLSGLGERRRVSSGTVDLDTHVEDVIAHIEMEDLANVDLVGWSYGGMVITGARSRISARIRSVIYLDAFVPTESKALIDFIDPARREKLDNAKNADMPVPPPPLEPFGPATAEILTFVKERLTNQPWRTFYQPLLGLTQQPAIPTTYIRCEGFDFPPFAFFLEEMKKDPAVETHVLDAGHLCMLTASELTSRLLAATR